MTHPNEHYPISVGSGRPPWSYHWPRSKTKESPCCGICGETDLFKLRYYLVGLRCDAHKPGPA